MTFPTARWGDLTSLEYGKALRGYQHAVTGYPVYGSSGIVGRSEHVLAQAPGVIVARKGSLGCHYAREPFFVIDTAFYLKAKPGCEVDLRWAFYALKARDFSKLDTGAAIPSLTREHFYSLEVPLPPIDIQRRIAAILGAYDDLIEVNRQRIAVLDELTRSLFNEWFVHLRFPGHKEVAIVGTPDGPLPDGWAYDLLGNVAEINASSLRPANAPLEIAYIDIASVSPGQIDNIKRLSFANAPGRARRRVKDGSILWSNVRPNRRSYALVLEPASDVIASTGFTVLDARETSFSYLYHWVTTDSFVGYLVGNATGAAYPAVTAATFERATVLLPPSDLVDRYARVAEPIMRQAHAIRRANALLGSSRDLLLPRLISGQLAVSVAERELEEAA